MTPIQAYEVEFGFRQDADGFNALAEAIDARLGNAASDAELVMAFRSLAGRRDWSHRGPTAGEIADAIRAERDKRAGARPVHSSECPLCDGAGVASWLWPWAGPLRNASGGVTCSRYYPPQPCLCALGEYMRREIYADPTAADRNRDSVRALMDAAVLAGADTAAKRMAVAEGAGARVDSGEPGVDSGEREGGR